MFSSFLLDLLSFVKQIFQNCSATGVTGGEAVCQSRVMFAYGIENDLTL